MGIFLANSLKKKITLHTRSDWILLSLIQSANSLLLAEVRRLWDSFFLANSRTLHSLFRHRPPDLNYIIINRLVNSCCKITPHSSEVMPRHTTAIVSHGEIDPTPLEVYGESGDVLLRIGYAIMS